MMNQKEVQNNMEHLIGLFQENGCSVEAIQDFIQNNFHYLIEEGIDSSEQLYFVYNHNDLYGVIWIYGDLYQWSIYDHGMFRKASKLDEGENDYIIDMILNFTNTDKIKKIVPNISQMNLENKVKSLKKLKLNSDGYHLK